LRVHFKRYKEGFKDERQDKEQTLPGRFTGGFPEARGSHQEGCPRCILISTWKGLKRFLLVGTPRAVNSPIGNLGLQEEKWGRGISEREGRGDDEGQRARKVRSEKKTAVQLSQRGAECPRIRPNPSGRVYLRITKKGKRILGLVQENVGIAPPQRGKMSEGKKKKMERGGITRESPQLRPMDA